MIQIGSKKHAANLQPYLPANRPCDLVVVAGEDFCGYAMVLQCLDGLCSGFLRRIQKGEISDQHHVTFIHYAESSDRRGIALLCNGQNPEALVV